MITIIYALVLQGLGIHGFCARYRLEQEAFIKMKSSKFPISILARRFNLVTITVGTLSGAIIGMVLFVRALVQRCPLYVTIPVTIIDVSFSLAIVWSVGMGSLSLDHHDAPERSEETKD
jgi:hypothetical protein